MTDGGNRVLVLFAHPALERSRANRALLDAITDIPGVTIHDLYEAYPKLVVSPRREQQMLLDHDIIVLQHPFYWYSSPALVKEWQDHVLSHGWAYGEGGTALHGKSLMMALTTGGPQAAYQPGGRNRFTIRQLLAPQDQTAHLCGMRFLAPFVVHAAMSQRPEQLAATAQRYRQVLCALRDGTLDLTQAEQAQTINDLISPKDAA